MNDSNKLSSEAPPIAQQEQYYSERWRREKYANRLSSELMGSVLQLLAQADGPYPPRICDLGCGRGWSTAILSEFGKATGVDLADLSEARLRYPQCEFHSVNIPDWDAPAAEFDLVVSQEVIEHIERSLQPKFLAIANQLLKPGGYLILTTPNRPTLNAIPAGGRSYTNQPIEEWLNARDLRQLMRKAGFDVLHLNSLILGVGSRGLYRFVNSTKLHRLWKVLGMGEFSKWAACRAGFGLHLIVLARKPFR